MYVYYNVKFQLCMTSGSKVSRGVQNCTLPDVFRPPLNRVKARGRSGVIFACLAHMKVFS